MVMVKIIVCFIFMCSLFHILGLHVL